MHNVQVRPFARNMLLYSIAAIVLVLLFLIWRPLSIHVPEPIRSVPPDVRAVISDFTHTEELEYASFSVQGGRAVQRGKTLLGLRVTAVNTTLFYNIKGAMRSAQGELLRFNASDASWEMDSSRPLLLEKNIDIVLRGTRLRQIKKAWLHLREGTLVVQNGKTIEYSLR